PASRVRDRARVRQQRPGPRTGDENRAIARQPGAPIVEAGLQSAFDQQACQARTIDEEISRDLGPVFESQTAHESIVGFLKDLDDASLAACDAESFRI